MMESSDEELRATLARIGEERARSLDLLWEEFSEWMARRQAERQPSDALLREQARQATEEKRTV